jgi:hypothetical protein
MVKTMPFLPAMTGMVNESPPFMVFYGEIGG